MGKKPIIYELASDELVKKYLDESQALAKEIINSESNVEIKGTKYYVSSSEGDDNNDGLTPATAWKSIDKLNKTKFAYGDGVLFKRGDEWRYKDALNGQSGVTYTAYGEGKKPRLNGSVDASSPDDWEKTEFENVWHYTKKTGGFTYNVGCIVFDGGRAWGVLVTPVKSGETIDRGVVFNGLEYYENPVEMFKGPASLKCNLEFHHSIANEDPTVDDLWLYCKDGNPGEVFDTIDLVDRGTTMWLEADPETKWAHDIVVDNIDFYGACFGVACGNVKNTVVQNCTFRWIGGPVQGVWMFGGDTWVRYGNAIECFGRCDGFIMRYNYATHVYDCCWTAQHTGKVSFNDVQIYKNVADFSNTGPEVWIGDGGHITNLQIHDNYNRFMGYGWSHQRPAYPNYLSKKESGWIGAGGIFYGAYVTHESEGSKFENNDVYHNVNLFAGSGLSEARFIHPKTYNFHDNICILEEGKRFGRWLPAPAGRLYNYNKEDLTEIVKQGLEKGTDFYYTKPNPLGDMYKLCLPDSEYML
ncbi:MAG: hypothetical protein E7635_00715 [Ruminococcaceae bacterium]|nr:hypothetical protein [Oscillospiraceae bacterium]